MRGDEIPYFSDLDVHAMVDGLTGHAPDWVRAIAFQRAIGPAVPRPTASARSKSSSRRASATRRTGRSPSRAPTRSCTARHRSAHRASRRTSSRRARSSRRSSASATSPCGVSSTSRTRARSARAAPRDLPDRTAAVGRHAAHARPGARVHVGARPARAASARPSATTASCSSSTRSPRTGARCASSPSSCARCSRPGSPRSSRSRGGHPRGRPRPLVRQRWARRPVAPVAGQAQHQPRERRRDAGEAEREADVVELPHGGGAVGADDDAERRDRVDDAEGASAPRLGRGLGQQREPAGAEGR